MASGKLEKMTITAYSKPDFSGQVGQPFSVLVNPEKYSHTHTISYNKETAQGAPGTAIKFEKIEPEKVSFELVFDGTGVIPGSPSNIEDQVVAFKKLAYDYNGDIHSTNYLIVSWGTLIFKCRLTTLEVSYTLFKSDGTPLRAKATANFEEYTDARTLAKEANESSPDLTHQRMVVAGDTLPLMCERIYGTPEHYLQVAEANGLTNFRRLKPGTRIFFPPIAP